MTLLQSLGSELQGRQNGVRVSVLFTAVSLAVFLQLILVLDKCLLKEIDCLGVMSDNIGGYQYRINMSSVNNLGTREKQIQVPYVSVLLRHVCIRKSFWLYAVLSFLFCKTGTIASVLMFCYKS